MYKADDRTAWEKLAPGVTKALDRLLRKNVQTLGAALPSFGADVDDKTLSAIENLYDLLFDTEDRRRASSKMQRLGHAPDLVAKIAAWKGAAEDRMPKQVGQAAQNAAAELYMDLVRQLEGWRTYEIADLLKLLPVQLIKLGTTFQQGPLYLTKQVGPLKNRAAAAATIALFLTLPNEAALVVDAREGEVTDETRKAGHPLFYVNLEPFRFNGTNYVVRGGQLVGSRPAPKPQPTFQPTFQPTAVRPTWQRAMPPTRPLSSIKEMRMATVD
jgi:hypothetical protein